MSEQKKEYYLKEGRLDLSSLEAIGQKEIKVKESGVCNDLEEKIILPNLYKDSQIDGILKEMGEYFSGL